MKYRLTDRLTPLKGRDEFQENDIRVEIMTEEELKAGREPIPRKKVLLGLMERIQYCRAETFGSCIVGTLVILEVENLLVRKTDFGFYIAKNRIIFVDSSGFVESVIKRLMENHYEVDVSIAVFLADFLNRLVEDDSVYLQEYENCLLELEEEILQKGQAVKRNQKHSCESIVRYRKDMLRLHSYFSQLEDFGDVIRSNTNHMFTSEELNLFAVFSHHVSRLSSHTKMLRDYIVQIYDMYQSQLDLLHNRTMNLLTVITAIFLPLTLLVGWYGMNFTHMPELSWQHGYLWAMGLSIVIVLVEIYIFKKKHLL